MTDKNIEVEFRACLDENKYKEIMEFFDSKGEFIFDGERVTTKYGPADVRIREDWNGTSLMLKVGGINELQREEYKVNIDSSSEMMKIIEILGLKYVHSWKTIRKKFKFKGFNVCIDDISGFMKTIEIEKVCSIDEAENCKREIQELFDSLDLKAIDPEWFNNEIKKYNQNFVAGKIKV